jgi:NADH-quinone oxidoreductase subunit E
VALSEAEIEAIRKEAAHYRDKSAASIDALRIVQQHRGWVSDEHIKDVAELLGMSPDQLDGVATFYNLIYRRPVGKKVIHYCNSVSCWMLGADELRVAMEKRLRIRLGETTQDGEYTLLPIVCLGACDRAPVMMVGEETHFDVDPAKLDAILPVKT